MNKTILKSIRSLALASLLTAVMLTRVDAAPSSSLEKAFLDLRIVLSIDDIHADSNVSWRIAVGVTDLDALANKKYLAWGKTDKNGEVLLSLQERKALYAACLEHPEQLWFIYNSQVLHLTAQQVDGRTNIVLVRPKSAIEQALDAKAAEERANRAKPLPASTYTQAGFDGVSFGKEFESWRSRFKVDLLDFQARMKADPEYGRRLLESNEKNAFKGLFGRSVDPGPKGINVCRMIVEAAYSRDRRVSPAGSVMIQLLLEPDARPVGFGGSFKDEERFVELWYMLFDDVGTWNLQDFKDSLVFRAFGTAELPPFNVIKRGVWPALVFVRNQDGQIMLYGVSQELARIFQSIFNAQIS